MEPATRDALGDDAILALGMRTRPSWSAAVLRAARAVKLFQPGKAAARASAAAATAAIRRAVRETDAVIRIQRRWRFCIANPAHPVCKSRLEREWADELCEGV
jgi:hypothetical protein